MDHATRPLCLAAWLATGMIVAAPTVHADPPELVIASCVAGSPPMHTAGNAERALLDPVDRLRFQAAAQARYPLYERGSQPGPQHVLMLHQNDQWLYVTLQRLDSGDACFTAAFAAEHFGFTPGWLVKYRPQPGAGAD